MLNHPLSTLSGTFHGVIQFITDVNTGCFLAGIPTTASPCRRFAPQRILDVSAPEVTVCHLMYEATMHHAVLLGDSILDNRDYVCGGSPIVEQLRSRLPRDWRVTLLARDGAIALSVLKQLQSVPADASHLIVSAGGNDALECSPFLNSPARDSKTQLAELAAIQIQFQNNYRQMICGLRETGLPIVACTIYDGIPDLQQSERMALSLFNDRIMRELISWRIPVLDLRSVCNELRDYSTVSPIEPSEIGGFKIAGALQNILLSHDFSQARTVVYP